MQIATTIEYLTDWLKEKVTASGARGVVSGVSGGVDSAVAAVIAKKAFPDTCQGLILPCDSVPQDIADAETLLRKFEIEYKIIPLDEVYSLLFEQLNRHFELTGAVADLINGNIKPRLRMLTLYFFAQAQKYLVLGTDNKSELAVGYSTKYGDSGVDLQLLGDLSKTEVYALAEYLKIPQTIIMKKPSAGLWVGQNDETELGFTYKELDTYLTTGEAEPQIKERIRTLFLRSEHKRNMPPIAYLPENCR